MTLGMGTPGVDPRYPIGASPRPESIEAAHIHHYIASLAALPENLRSAVYGLSEAQLNTPYREGGWTVRQVVHHLPDSHLNSYTRFRLALTEDAPTIKPYDEKKWAELPDARTAPIEISLNLLESLHHRWAMLLRSLKPEDWARTFQHPERGPMTLDQNLALYAWHGRHHVAHITSLRERMGWAK